MSSEPAVDECDTEKEYTCRQSDIRIDAEFFHHDIDDIF